MTVKKNLMSELDAMVKRAAAAKAEVLSKKASIGDEADDKTKPAATGEQAAANKAALKDQQIAVTVDTGATPNKANASVENHISDGAAAVQADGQGGATGGVLAAKSTEPLTSADAMKTARALVAELRKAAAEGTGVTTAAEQAAAIGDGGAKVAPGGAKAEPKAKVAPLTVSGAKAETDAPVGSKTAGIRSFLAKAALANPQVKVAAEEQGMGEEQVGDAAGENLLQQLESGQVSDEEATQILEEALQSGAITEEEIAEAMQGHPEAGGEAPVEGAPVDPAAAGAEAPIDPAMLAAAGGEAPVDPAMLEAAGAPMDPTKLAHAKIAAAGIGPDDKRYMSKIAALYGNFADAGYALAVKLAEELTEVGESKEHEKDETPAEEKAEHEGDGLSASTPEEKAALKQAQSELGLSDTDLKALVDAPAPKTASAADKYRAAILNKVAALKAAK